MSGINSKETSSPPSTSRTTRKNAPLEPGGFTGLSIGIMGMLISATIWTIGAKWTVDGLLVLFNGILHFLNSSYQVPVPPVFHTYMSLAVLPIIFSAVEWRIPFTQVGDEWYFSKPGAWVVWSIVSLFDAYTTYLGLGVDPGPEGMTILHQLAASVIPRALFALVLTAGPEWLAREMVTQIRAAFRTFFSTK